MWCSWISPGLSPRDVTARAAFMGVITGKKQARFIQQKLYATRPIRRYVGIKHPELSRSATASAVPLMVDISRCKPFLVFTRSFRLSRVTNARESSGRMSAFSNSNRRRPLCSPECFTRSN